MTERGAQLLQFPVPAVDAELLLTLVRWAIGIVALAAVLWVARVLIGMKERRSVVSGLSRTQGVR
jgi:hypothetical protein